MTETYARLQTRLREARQRQKAAANNARKASAYVALWLFVSLLVASCVVSLSATYGDRQRDA